MWESKKFVEENITEAIKALESFGSEYWFFTSPSISEGKNYLYAKNKKTQRLLESLLGVTFVDNQAVTSKLILRKEIKKLIKERLIDFT